MSQIRFDGKILREPQAASKLVVGIPPKANPLATGRVIVLGTSEGGAPGVVHWFADKSEAQDILRNGNALRAIGFIFNPSSQGDGAPAVGYVRTQTAVQGSLTKGSVKLTARDYGSWTNNISVNVENGTVTDTKKVSINYGDVFVIADNLGFALNVEYTGASTMGKLSVTTTSGGTTIAGAHGDTGTENTAFEFDLSLSDYDTVSKVVASINAVADWGATIYEEAPAGVGSLPSSVINDLAVGLCHNEGGLNLKAYPYIVKHWIDNNSAYLTASVETAGTQITDTSGYELLTGGTEGSMDTTAIANSLELIEEENCQIIWIDSDMAAQHAMVDAHCRNDAQNERMAFFGGSSQSSKSDAITDVSSAANVLNSARSVLVACGIKDFTADGSGVEDLPPKYLAAKMAGLTAGLKVYEPLTHKVFSCVSLQYDFTKSEREELINAGVLAPRYYEGMGFIVNQGINTLQNNLNLWDASTNLSPEISLMRSADQVNKELRVSAEKHFVGGTVGVGRDTILGFATSFLMDKEREGIIAANDSDPDNKLPAWGNVSATRLSDGWHVKYSVRFNNPFNFFLLETVAVL